MMTDAEYTLLTAADLRQIALAFLLAEPTRVIGKTRLYEMTEEVRDSLVRVLEIMATRLEQQVATE
jgi:hypothetical protein